MATRMPIRTGSSKRNGIQMAGYSVRGMLMKVPVGQYERVTSMQNLENNHRRDDPADISHEYAYETRLKNWLC